MASFLNPNFVVAQTGLMQGQTVADLGSGSGFYVLPSAQMVGNSGVVYAIDVLEEKLAATISVANQFGIKNVKVIQADLAKPFLDIPNNSCDLVIVGNIMHEISNREMLLKNIYRILKTPGHVLVVEWKKTATPFGPPLDKRIEPQTMDIMLMNLGLRKAKELDADRYHYAVLFEK